MKPISFRLRKDMDMDLIQALRQTEPTQMADLCRNGLRLMLGIRTTKHMQIVERPLITPTESIEVKGITSRIGSSGKPFVPNAKGG